MIYGKLTVIHDRQTDRQTDEVHVEITRKGLAHARPNYVSSEHNRSTVRLKFSVHDNANCGTIAVIASMTIMELFDEYPTPFSSDDSHLS